MTDHDAYTKLLTITIPFQARVELIGLAKELRVIAKAPYNVYLKIITNDRHRPIDATAENRSDILFFSPFLLL